RAKVLSDPSDPNVFLPRRIENQFHDSNGNGVQDPGEASTTLAERQAYWYRDASVKTNISPRLGISYPITDRGILHFSYGHFLQIPSFIHLYQKPDWKVTTASGIQGVYGNPDLKAQKTIMYELGLQQQLTDELSFDATLFYRDTRDWVTTSPSIDVGDPGSSTSAYVVYVNRDYANSRGITISANKRPSDLWTMNLAYTFQIAEGINSNPDDELAAQRDNTEPARSLTPLDWDQTHTVNLTLGLGEQDWGAYFIGRYGSGLPYTPSINQAESQGVDAARIVSNNSRRRPPTMNIDVRLFKNFTVEPLNLSLFLRVFNLLDRRNEVTVYGETGRASASVQSLGIGETTGDRLNPVSAYIVRPDFYSEPREVQLGLEVTF
ncbi:MAG: TonB-dependent receptor, partial [Ignavibacteria bacterium]|nr:TonB-dependent receptor [Ignavibacteria bacterium]